MRANNLSRFSDLQIIYTAAIINSLLFIILYGFKVSADTPSYISAWDVFKNGGIDSFRTPTFPYVYGFYEMLLGKGLAIYGVGITQYAVFLLSIWSFYQIVMTMLSSRRLVFWITLLYALCPMITTQNICILTESFAISLSVFYVHAFIFSIYKNSLRFGLLATVVLFLLIFLRPAQIFFVPVTLMTYFFVAKKCHRKVLLINIAGTIIVTLSMLTYMYAFQQKYGIFAASDVGIANQYHMARRYGYLDVSSIKNADVREYARKSYEAKGKYVGYDEALEFWMGVSKFDYSVLEQSNDLKQSIKLNRKEWLKSIPKRLEEWSKSPIMNSYVKTFYKLIKVGSPNFLFVIYLLIVVVVMSIRYYLRTKKIAWMTMFLSMLIASSLIVTFVGAQSEWSRLNVPVLPFVFILTALVVQALWHYGNHSFGKFKLE